jgi:hypothetical protein
MAVISSAHRACEVLFGRGDSEFFQPGGRLLVAKPVQRGPIRRRVAG